MIRAQALEATASGADQTWLNSVRLLLGDPDPLVRLLAAKLIAPHDGPAAEAAVRGLMNDSNIAVQEVANQTLAEVVATDWPTLRRYLRSSDPVIRTAAAARILDLTR
jgi:HEAT repeat protein